jgi:hypothetical protein
MRKFTLLVSSLLFFALEACSPMTRPNTRGTGTLVLNVPPDWAGTRDGMSLNIRGPGLLMGIHHMKRSAFAAFEHNERERYSSIAKEKGVTVTEQKVSLGQCAGLRWLAKKPDGISGHYLLQHDRAFVLVELFRAETEKSIKEVEAVLATISIQPESDSAATGTNFPQRQREYDLRTGPARLRVFADNYQFLLFDPAVDPFRPFPQINEATSRQGWTRNEHALWVFTRAHYNAHRLDVSLADQYRPDPAAARQTVHNLALPGGSLALFEHPDHIRFRVAPGAYQVYCRAYNLGSEDPNGMAFLSDDEFFGHNEWERYEIILVPGSAEREGEL